MNVEEQLEVLKTGILSLKAAGPDGFEGLLRIALTNLTSIPFRLAASGLQGGMDGDAAIPGDPVCFEAKRYSCDIHRNDVLVKIADLSREPDRVYRRGWSWSLSGDLSREFCVVEVPFCCCG